MFFIHHTTTKQKQKMRRGVRYIVRTTIHSYVYSTYTFMRLFSATTTLSRPKGLEQKKLPRLDTGHEHEKNKLCEPRVSYHMYLHSTYRKEPLAFGAESKTHARNPEKSRHLTRAPSLPASLPPSLGPDHTLYNTTLSENVRIAWYSYK